MFAGLQVKCHIRSFRTPSVKVIIATLVIIKITHTVGAAPPFAWEKWRSVFSGNTSVLRCCFHTTADQERAPTHTKKKKEHPFHSNNIGSDINRSEERKKGLYTGHNTSAVFHHPPPFFSTNRRDRDAHLAVSKCADTQPTVTLSYTNSWTKCKIALKYIYIYKNDNNRSINRKKSQWNVTLVFELLKERTTPSEITVAMTLVTVVLLREENYIAYP